MSIRTTASLCVLGLLGLALPAFASEPAKAEIGKPAPDFKLKDINGTEHTLASLRGKIVVLEWTNHECPFVKARAGKDKVLGKTYAELKSDNVVWFAINSSNFANDRIEELKTWTTERGIEYPILLDADGKTGHAYGAKTTPHMFVIDQKGILAYMGALDDDARGNKTDARNYVVEAVEALEKDSTVATATTEPYGCSVKYAK